MNTVRRIAKNTLVLLVAQIVSMGLGFFYIMYTARYLGAEGFGVLSFALAFTGIFGLFADLGLSSLTTREIARDKSLAGKYLGNVAVMKMVLVVITFSLIVIAINLMGYPEQTIKVVYIVALAVLFSAFNLLFNSIFQSYEKMEYVSIGKLLYNMFIFVGVLYAIWHDFNVIGFAVIYLLASLATLIYSFVAIVGKFHLTKIKLDWGFWKPTIKEALPFGFSGIFITIYFWVDSIMLSYMIDNEVVGWYNASYRLVFILLFIPSIINTAIFPSMSKFYFSSHNSLRLITEKYFKFMLIISIPIGVGTTLLAEKVILLIFGTAYIQSIIILQILIWAMVFTFVYAAFGLLFQSINKQIIITKITGIGMILNVILNLLLIPLLSHIGASITTAITEFTILLLVTIYAYKIGYGIKRTKFLNYVFRPAVASAIMGSFIWRLINMNLIVLLVFSILLYFGILFTIKGINREDIELIKNIRGI